MKRFKFTFLLFALVLYRYGPAHAADSISLEAKALPLRTALFTLFQKAGESFLLEPGIFDNQQVTLSIKNAPFEQALRTLCQSSSVTCRKEGSVYVISPSHVADVAAPPNGIAMRFAIPQAISPHELSLARSASRRVAPVFSGPQRSGATRQPFPYMEFDLMNKQIVLRDLDRVRTFPLTPSAIRTEDRSKFTCPHCRKSVTIVEQPKSNCAQCSQPFQPDWTYCPFDGAKRTMAIDEWKACPFCAREVKPRAYRFNPWFAG